MKSKMLKTLITFLLIVSAVWIVDAQKRRSSRPTKAIKTPMQQTTALVPVIETKISVLNGEIDRVAARGTISSSATDTMSDYLSRLDESVARLRDALDSGGYYTEDLRDTLEMATRIDQFLGRNRISPSAVTQWRSLKRDFTSLSTYNRLAWNWNRTLAPLPNTTAGVTPTPTPYPTPYPTPLGTPVPTPWPTPWPAPGGSLTYSVSDAQMSTLLSRINLKTGFFRTQVESSLRTGNPTDVSVETVQTMISRFESAQSRLRQNFERREGSLLDFTDMMTAATYIDQFMARNRLATEAEGQWRDLRGDLNTLTTYYNQAWNWNQNLPSSTVGGTVNLRNIESRITGTFRLNPSLSEDPADAIARATGSLSGVAREDQRIGLQRRLRPPEMLAIEMNNRTVNMASSILPRVTFQADGRARSETNERGRTVTTTATLDSDGLTINFLGERASDFYLTIVPASDGRLRVTRRIFTENSNEGIRVTSVYDKIDTVARWDELAPATPASTGGVIGSGVPTPTGQVDQTLIVPVGTQLDTELRTPISGSQNTDRVTLLVTTPGQFRGAAINGRVLAEDPASRMAGRARVLVAFDTITLRTGATYRFSGDVSSVNAVSGGVVDVSTQPVTRAPQPQKGAGAILGALIGAIAGVPVNQAGTVGGSILSQRADTFYLAAGSQVSLVSTSPVQ